MIVSRDLEAADRRVWVTRFNSVVTYFTSKADGGVELHIEPGFAADPYRSDAITQEVRDAVLVHVAERLGVAVGEVLQQPMSTLASVADPELPPEYRYARRSQNRSYPRRF